MLKHRIQGLVCLHCAILFVAVAMAFLAYMTAVSSWGLITFNTDVNWGLYFAGVLGGMGWVYHNFTGVGFRLGSMSLGEVIRLSIQQLVRVMVILVTLAFATRDVQVSRAFLLSFVAVVGTVLFLANLFLPRLLIRAFFRTQSMRTIVYSSPSESEALRRWVEDCGEYGVELVGYVSEETDTTGKVQLPRLGSPDQLPALLRASIVDQVVADQRFFNAEQAKSFSQTCEQSGSRVRFYLNMDTMFPGMPALQEHNGAYSFAAYTPEPLENPLNRVMKRAFDIAVSLPVVLFILPAVTAAVLIAQRLQSPGPVFYRQMRSGMNRRKFEIYKFRTMHLNNTVAKQATKNDSRIYAFGRFLRRSSLDELPQFINVLRGEMSVNGPRPHLIEHDELFAKAVHNYRKRHFVKPGITGLAQSKGYRGEIAEHRAILNRVRYDMYYVAHWSLVMDIKILINTVRQVVHPPKSAY